MLDYSVNGDELLQWCLSRFPMSPRPRSHRILLLSLQIRRCIAASAFAWTSSYPSHLLCNTLVCDFTLFVFWSSKIFTLIKVQKLFWSQNISLETFCHYKKTAEKTRSTTNHLKNVQFGCGFPLSEALRGSLNCYAVAVMQKCHITIFKWLL